MAEEITIKQQLDIIHSEQSVLNNNLTRIENKINNPNIELPQLKELEKEIYINKQRLEELRIKEQLLKDKLSKQTTISNDKTYEAEIKKPQDKLFKKLISVLVPVSLFVGGYAVGSMDKKETTSTIGEYEKEEVPDQNNITVKEEATTRIIHNIIVRKAPVEEPIANTKTDDIAPTPVENPTIPTPVTVETNDNSYVGKHLKEERDNSFYYIPGKTVIEKIYNYLKNVDMPDAGIAGIFASIDQESFFMPNGETIWGIEINGDRHYGLFQWTDNMDVQNKTKYINYCKERNINPDELKSQLDFFWYDFQKYKYFNQFMEYAREGHAYNAGLLFASTYEAPFNLENQARTRAFYAEKFYKDIINGNELHSYR